MRDLLAITKLMVNSIFDIKSKKVRFNSTVIVYLKKYTFNMHTLHQLTLHLTNKSHLLVTPYTKKIQGNHCTQK